MAEPTLSTFEFDVITVNAQGQETSRIRRQAESFTEDLGNGVELKMVAIPGGSFLMGSPESEEGYQKWEGPLRPVTVPAFFMGRYSVTQIQWRAVADLPQLGCALDPAPSEWEGSNQPVEQVDWYKAVEFCDRLSQHTGKQYRLPSEAEWEYACRAGTTTPFHFGETITTALANYNVNSTYAFEAQSSDRVQTMDVGRFPPNAFGIYDLHGNVWEWCADQWHDSYEGAPSDGSAWVTGNNTVFRLLRGGSWDSSPRHCRSACRHHIHMGDRSNDWGFRVVCAAL